MCVVIPVMGLAAALAPADVAAVVCALVGAPAEFSRARLAAAVCGLTIGATRGAKPINDDVVIPYVVVAAAVVFMVGAAAAVVVGTALVGRPGATAAGLAKRERSELLPGPVWGADEERSACQGGIERAEEEF